MRCGIADGVAREMFWVCCFVLFFFQLVLTALDVRDPLAFLCA